MQVEWYGQSAFRLSTSETTVAIDPFGDMADAQQAAAIVERLSPRWVVPMHYRTPRIGFLETADAFLDAAGQVERLSSPSFDTGDLPETDGPLIVVPAAP